MISCDHAKQHFSAYLDNALSASDQAELEVHLSHCNHCRSTYAQIVHLHQRMHNLTAVNTSAQFDQQLRARIRQAGSSNGRRRSAFKSLYLGISGVTALAAVTFFTLTTINEPAVNSPVMSAHSASQISTSKPFPRQIKAQPQLATDALPQDSLKNNPKTVDQKKIHLVGQEQR